MTQATENEDAKNTFSTHSLITGTKRTFCAFCLSLVQCQQFLLVLGSSDITSVWIRSPAERPGTVQSELPPPANQIEPIKPNIRDSGTTRCQNSSLENLRCATAAHHPWQWNISLRTVRPTQNQGAETWPADTPVREKGMKLFCNQTVRTEYHFVPIRNHTRLYHTSL